MQFILDKDELDELRQAKATAAKAAKDALQGLCTRVADWEPVIWGWGAEPDPKPWGCILTVKGEWYCDCCPVKDMCPYTDKQWSK